MGRSAGAEKPSSMPADAPRPASWALFWGTVAAFGILVGLQLVFLWGWFQGWTSLEGMVLADDGSRALMAGWAAWCLGRLSARDPGAYGATWRWMARGLACLAAATVFLVGVVDLAKVPPPWSLLRHAGYLGFFACLGRALMLMPTSRGLPSRRVQALLDGVMISASLFFVAW